MAATDRAPRTAGTLQALTVAALALPGLAGAAGDDDEFAVQYSHFGEGHRALHGYNSRFAALTADSLAFTGALPLPAPWHAHGEYSQDTWSGATPVTTLPFAAMTRLTEAQIIAGASAKPSTGQLLPTLVDAALNTYSNYGTNKFKPLYARDDRVVHMMTSASPEVRKQGSLGLGYEFAGARVDAGAGISYEPDFISRFVNLGGALDFDQKRTTLAAGMSYTFGTTIAVLPDLWLDWVDPGLARDRGEIIDYGSYANGNPKREIKETRRDWTAHLALTRVLTQRTVATVGVEYTHSAGYLENPYRIVSFLSAGAPSPRKAIDGTPLYQGALYHTYEQRPDRRRAWNADLRLVQHVPWFDAALHVDYRYQHDNWGIAAHSVELAWAQPLPGAWRVTPHLRYYTQHGADFYHDFVTCGLVAGADCAHALGNFSSDYRLAGYGAASAGLTVTKAIGRGVSLELGGEYYAHAGALRLGSGGLGDYADVASFTASAGLRVALADAMHGMAALAAGTDGGGTAPAHAAHEHHAGHVAHTMPLVPPGLMRAQPPMPAGSVMLGYRYQYASQAGDMLRGDRTVDDGTIVTGGGCDAPGCSVRPRDMQMHMHMVDLMVAPTSWLTLMVMPQFMDMNMALAPLEGGVPSVHAAHEGHQTGGVGDLEFGAQLRLWSTPGHAVHAALDASAPTGDAGIRLNPVAGHNHDPDTAREPEYLHYGMQLGSGTWNLVPRLTYNGSANAWQWGAQAGARVHVERRNDDGYRPGDSWQASAWGGYRWLPWLGTTLRASHTAQGHVRGRFAPHAQTDVQTSIVTLLPNSIAGPMDGTASNGGRYWDLGIGIDVAVPFGTLRGSHFTFEWLEPLHDHVNGYQLERSTRLNAAWYVMF